jgi:hypothetical protein
VLGASTLALCCPVFSRADDGERRLDLEVAPHAGYGEYTTCDTLSRVRYGGLGAGARYRDHGLEARAAGSAAALRETRADAETGADPSVDDELRGSAPAQVGFDLRYVGAMFGGVWLGDSDGGDTLFPSAALRLGRRDGFSLRLGLLDDTNAWLAALSAELSYEQPDAFRVGFDVRGDLHTQSALPTLRCEFPLARGTWIGARLGGFPEDEFEWQAQAPLTVPLYQSPAPR